LISSRLGIWAISFVRRHSHLIISFIIIIIIKFGYGVWTQDIMLARLVFYSLSHASSPPLFLFPSYIYDSKELNLKYLQFVFLQFKEISPLKSSSDETNSMFIWKHFFTQIICRRYHVVKQTMHEVMVNVQQL
jgi:hypothetical protein